MREETSGGTPWARLLWPVACLALVLRVLESQRVPGFDLYIVRTGTAAYLSGASPYDFHLFIYPPSGALLLSWLGEPSFSADRVIFLIVGVAAVVASGLLAVRLAGHRWVGWAGATMVLGLAVYRPVFDTLETGNVNSVILFGEVLTLIAFSRGRWNAAAVPLGLTLAVKPVLVPFLLLPVLERRWRSIAITLVPVVALSALAVALNGKALDFFHETLPFLLKGNADFFRTHNVSLAGAGINLGVPTAAVAGLRLITAGVTLALATMRWRDGPAVARADILRVVETAAVLLLGTFLCFSIAWPYYGIYLVPLLATIGSERSLLRHPLALMGVFLLGSPDTFAFDHFHRAVTRFNEIRPTLGFACLLIGMGLVLLARRGARSGSSAQPAAVRSP